MDQEILSSIYQHCSLSCPKAHVLLLEDTTELNYHSHNGRLKVNDPDLGVISDNASTGLYVHPCLALEAASGFPIGYSHMKLYQHRFDRESKSSSARKYLPIEDKESFRWIDGPEQSRSVLASASKITVIADRESDIYHALVRIPDARTELVIRSNHDRVVDQGEKLSQALESVEWQAEKEFFLPATKKRIARQVKAKLRWKQVSVRKPAKKAKKRFEGCPDQVKVTVVEIKEVDHNVPEGESAVHWRIWTTHPVDSTQEALQIIKWYGQRWWIEELFRLIKKKGFQIESAQLTTGAALKKMIMLTLEQALKVLMLKHNRNDQLPISASRCFDQQEQLCLEAIAEQVEGKTNKLKNPFPHLSLAWAAWIIARLGGWTQADMKKRPPGVISYLRGLRRFTQIYQGFVAARKITQTKPRPKPT